MAKYGLCLATLFLVSMIVAEIQEATLNKVLTLFLLSITLLFSLSLSNSLAFSDHVSLTDLLYRFVAESARGGGGGVGLTSLCENLDWSKFICFSLLRNNFFNVSNHLTVNFQNIKG